MTAILNISIFSITMNSSYIEELLVDPLGNTTDVTSVSSAGNWTYYQIIVSLLLTLLTATTIVANSLVLYLFYKSKKTLRSPSHFLLANLAFSDLFVGLLVMPLLGSITVAHKYRWHWGSWMCSLSDYVHFTLCASSMMSMTGVAIERFIGIRFPLKHKRIMSASLVKKMIIAIWTLSITLISIPLTVWPYVQAGPIVCETNLNKPFVIFISFTVYWIPISLTTLLYIMIFIFALQPLPLALTRQVSKYPSASHPKLGYKESVANQKENRLLTARQRQITLAKSLTLILIVMATMFGPVFAMFLLKGLDSPFVSFERFLVAGWIRYCNSCVNPFLFALAVPSFRREFSKVFLNERRGVSDDGDSSCTSISESNDEEDQKASDDETGNEQSTVTTNRSKGFEVQEGALVSVPLSDESTRGLKEPLGPINILIHRFCTYCGVAMTLDEIHQPGKPQSCYCTTCFQKFASGQVTFTDSQISFSKPSCSKVPEANKEKLDATSVPKSTGESALRNEIDDKFMAEIRRYIELSEAKPTLNQLEEREHSKGSSETQLQNNLMKILTDSGDHEIPAGGKRLRKYDEKSFRKSIMSPIMKRRSRMVENKKPSEIDWDSIRELDEIIAKLNSTGFGSTVTNDTNHIGVLLTAK